MPKSRNLVPVFPPEEYERRLDRVRLSMETRRLDAILVSAPENVYYLTGLDHQGYFACQILIVPRTGDPILVTRAMEHATVRDQTRGLRHVGYSDGENLPPPPSAPASDIVFGTTSEEGRQEGLRPWEMSFGMATREEATDPVPASAPVRRTCDALRDAGLADARLGIEKSSSFLPFSIAESIVTGMSGAHWEDASGLVDDVRIVQSPRELERTRVAASISDAMMLAAVAAASPGVSTREVMAAIYDAMFRRDGTYPGFVPLVRATRTIEHEHGTWDGGMLKSRDLLFLEMAGCVRRYHAPIGRLVFVGKVPTRAEKVNRLCRDALEAATEAIRPGIEAGRVYAAWHAPLERAGLGHFARHHCGYSVGIGFPPSWSGGGVPVGLRAGSSMVLREGMVFHLMSWLLRTGRGDSFVSDTVVVTKGGCEPLTTVTRDVIVR